MMSSISPREEQPNSKAKKSFETLYNERTMSLRTEGLSPSYGHTGLVHSDVGFTPSPRHEKSKKALSNSPSRPISDGITVGASSTFNKHQATSSVDLIVSGSHPSAGDGWRRKRHVCRCNDRPRRAATGLD